MVKTPVTFEEAVEKYDRKGDQEAIALAEQERQEVIKRFPLDAWPQMDLKHYALGQGKKHDAFCWWLEFGTPHVGSIRGGNARKHNIYRQSDGDWWFDRENFKNEQEAWQAVRSGFLEAFDKAKNGDWNTLITLRVWDQRYELRRSIVIFLTNYSQSRLFFTSFTTSSCWAMRRSAQAAMRSFD